MTLFTMQQPTGAEILYKVNNNGTAITETGEIIDDFANEFLAMCDIGWKPIFELVIDTSEINVVTSSNVFDRRLQFRHDWYAYEDRILEELSI